MAQSYKVGTVTVTNGSTAVTGSGTAWELALVTAGLFCCGGEAIPCTVVDDTHLTLDVAYQGVSGAALEYSIFRETAQAASAVEANDRIAEVAYRLRTHSYINFDASGTLAQRANYNTAPKDFLYLQTDVSPFRLFVKRSATSGDWAGPNNYGQGEQGPIAPFAFAAPVAAAPDASPAVVNLGTPTAPELQFTIPRGQGVRDRGNYAGGTAYDAYDTVLNNGSTWIALVTGPAGVAPPVLPTEANAKWRLFARKGTDGAGDLTGPSSSVAGATARFSDTTGKIISSGQVVSTETNLDNYRAEGDFITPASGLTNLPSGWAQSRHVVDVGGGTYAYQIIHRPTGGFAHRSWNGVVYSAWAEVFSRENILGAVSQAAGVPTGALIESGSNANGSYTRFANGLQICRGTRTFTSVAIDVAWGTAMFQTATSLTIPLPAEFVGEYSGTATAAYGDNTSTFFCSNAASAPPNSIILTRPTSLTAANRTVAFMFIGRWF